MAKTCPACGAIVPQGRMTCPACKLNLHYAERVGVDEARSDGPKPARPSGWEDVRDVVAALVGPFLVLGGVVATLVLLVFVVLPVGPDVTADELERSILAALRSDGPPSSDGANTTLDCTHPLTNTRTFSCEGREDIALLPDAALHLKVEVRTEGGRACWTAKPRDDGSAASALVPEKLAGCVT